MTSASCCTGIGGQIVVPFVGLLLVISSFFAKIPGGIKWALFVFASIVLQVAMGLLAFGAPRWACCTD